MGLESLYDCPDLLADRVRQFEILHPGTRGNRLKSATPALAPERLEGDVGAASGREGAETRGLPTERADRVRRRAEVNVQGTVNLPVSRGFRALQRILFERFLEILVDGRRFDLSARRVPRALRLAHEPAVFPGEDDCNDGEEEREDEQEQAR